LLLLFVSAPLALAAEPADKERMDQAIKRGLEFLHRSQDRDGAWAGGPANNPAITSFAVMAFLSAGHVPGEGPYGETVKKGVEWVLKRQAANGLIATAGHQEMYHHGIATLMLAEVAGMTDTQLGKDVRQALEKAVEVILVAQRKDGQHRGGWRYTRVGYDGDLSVTGWQIMALRAAKNLGCDVPADKIEEAVGYIKRCQQDTTGGFCYFPGSRLTVPCTGTAILALEICGKNQHRSREVLKAAAFLREEGKGLGLRNKGRFPTWGSPYFFYSVYYCSQAMFQLGGNEWIDARPKLHKEILDNQAANGSWLSPDGGSRPYGHNYCTAMAVLSLTVEYRYLPIYQRGEEPTDK
jgi:hypothetical protein